MLDNDDYDIIGLTGPLPNNPDDPTDPEWPMYSFSMPSVVLWSAIGNALLRQGWTKTGVKEWLQSEESFWAMNDRLNDCIEALGQAYGAEVARKHQQERTTK